MSRFADPSATGVVDLGACQCRGTPHARDEAVVRWQLSGSAMARIERATLAGAFAGDPFSQYRQVVVEALVSWTLLLDEVDDKGEPVPAPVTPSWIGELDIPTLTALAEGIDRIVAERGTVPNGSGAPSAESPRESASPTPTPTPAPGT